MFILSKYYNNYYYELNDGSKKIIVLQVSIIQFIKSEYLLHVKGFQ